MNYGHVLMEYVDWMVNVNVKKVIVVIIVLAVFIINLKTNNLT